MPMRPHNPCLPRPSAKAKSNRINLTTTTTPPPTNQRRVGAPQPADMASIAAERVLEMLRDVDKSVVPVFR
jgi:hypothetical protein